MYKYMLIPALIVASISSIAVAQDRSADDKNRGNHSQRSVTPTADQYRPDNFPSGNNQSKDAQGATTNTRGNAYLPDEFPSSNNRSTAPYGNTTDNADYHANLYRPDDFPGSNNRGQSFRPGRPQRTHDRGAGPGHDLRKGNRLPVEYRNPQYVVQDWHGSHLSKPKRGYQWVRTGNDYLLVATATGLISTVLLGP